MKEDVRQARALALAERMAAYPDSDPETHEGYVHRRGIEERVKDVSIIYVPRNGRQAGIRFERTVWDEESYAQEVPWGHPYPDPWAAARKICKPQEYKLLLELYYHDTKLGQVAESWNINKGTLSKLRKKALAKLRRYLELHNV